MPVKKELNSYSILPHLHKDDRELTLVIFVVIIAFLFCDDLFFRCWVVWRTPDRVDLPGALVELWRDSVESGRVYFPAYVAALGRFGILCGALWQWLSAWIFRWCAILVYEAGSLDYRRMSGGGWTIFPYCRKMSGQLDGKDSGDGRQLRGSQYLFEKQNCKSS